MAFSVEQYTAVADQVDFTISFDYLDTEHIFVYVNDVLVFEDTDYTFFNTSTIRFGTAPGFGADVVIQRLTSPDARLADYFNTAQLTEELLDTDSLQAFYLSQEALDYAEQALRFPAGETPTELPSVSTRSGAYLGFDANGRPVAVSAAVGDTLVSDYGGTLLDDADAAEARSTLGLGTAAVQNVGTAPGNVVQLTGGGGLPAVDGSGLLNVGQWELIASVGPSSGWTSANLDGLNTTHIAALLVIDSVIPEATGAHVRLRLRNSSGAIVGNNYTYSIHGVAVNGTVISQGSITTTSAPVGFNNLDSTAQGLSGRVFLPNIRSATAYPMGIVDAVYYLTTGMEFTNCGFSYSVGSELITGVTVYMTSSTSFYLRAALYGLKG